MEEADEARDWLDHLHENGIAGNVRLRQEALELTKIFKKSLSTTFANSRRIHDSKRKPQDRE